MTPELSRILRAATAIMDFILALYIIRRLRE